MKWGFLAPVLLAVSISGCATGYHSANNPILGLTGGYWDRAGPGSTIKVGFAGNGYISRDKVGTYVLFRCAEVAKREGGTHFVLYQTLMDAVDDRRSSERAVSTIGGKPTTYVSIWVVKADERDALAVDDVIARLGPEVGTAQQKQGAQ